MEKYCSNCNRPNPTDAVFCRHCATPLQPGGGQKPFSEPQQNQQQYQQWNQPPPGGQMQGNFGNSQPTAGASGRAIASLVLAIAGFLFCCFFLGVPGAILGWLEINAIKEGRSSPKGLVMAQIGLWGGIGVSVLSALFYVFYILIAMMGGGGYGY